MQTFLYNLDTNKQEGPIRDGYFTVDGQRPTLPSNFVEVEIVYPPQPNYDPSTQKLNYIEYLDLLNQQFVKTYEVVNLTQEELDSLSSSQNPFVPESCTPRQFRLALLDFGIDPDSITTIINSLPDPDEKKRVSIIWEYSNSIERYDPLIMQFAQILSVPTETVDDIFIRAITYI